ncbi:MAG TPA: neutral zinc metallopeptidase [Pseudonocardiaceae bacterium]|nr:neutral zinc metallopeptidase [Pseudonocardiaceae bacterium]
MVRGVSTVGGAATEFGRTTDSPDWLLRLATPPPPPPPPNARRSHASSITMLAFGALLAITFVVYVGHAARTGTTAATSGDGPRPADPAPAATGPQPTSTAPPTTTSTSTSTRITPPPQKVTRLGDNPIFTGASLAAVECALPEFGADPAVQLAFYRAAVGCLNRAWLPVLAAAALPAQPPQVAVPTDAYPTPCGNKSATDNANYCEGVIYLPPRYFAEVEDAPTTRISAYLGVLAHEYGHHVQELAGVMDAAWAQRYEAGPGSPAGLEISRRNELGASCFGGMFLASTAGHGSISRELAEQIVRDQGRRGDRPDSGLPSDHGTPDNNGHWYSAGYQHNDTATCNTWLAPAERVA